MCLYVVPSEDAYSLMDKIFNRSMKEDVLLMKEFNEQTPVIFRFLSAFEIETNMPLAFRKLFGKLMFLSRKPFQNDGESTNSKNLLCDNKYLIGFFPKLPKLRPRGV